MSSSPSFSPWQGPYFAPPYECLPPDVQFSYNDEPMELSEKAEEAAGFFAKMLDHDYTKKDIFCNNFFEDWRKVSPAGISDNILLLCEPFLRFENKVCASNCEFNSYICIGATVDCQ